MRLKETEGKKQEDMDMTNFTSARGLWPFMIFYVFCIAFAGAALHQLVA